MVACKLLGEHLSPGRELLERRHASTRSPDELDLLPAEVAEPDSLLAELNAIQARQSLDRLHIRLYTTRNSLDDAPSPQQELAWQGSTVVWSIGSSVHRTFTFNERGQDGQVVQALFAHFPPPPVRPASPIPSTSKAVDIERKALFGAFAPAQPPAWTDELRFGEQEREKRFAEREPTPLRGLCIFLRDVLFIHFPATGRDYYVHMPFKLEKAWSMQTGLLVERRREDDEVPGPAQLATLYSLSDPLDEFRIVATVPNCSSPAVPDHRPEGATAAPSNEYVVCVADREGDPKYLFTFDPVTARVTVWAYVFVPESEARREAERTRLTSEVEDGKKEATKSKGKGRARPSLPPPPSSPSGLPTDRTRAGRTSMAPPAEPTTGIAKRLREERRMSTRPMGHEASFALHADRMALGDEHEKDTTMLRQASAAEPAGEDQPMRSEVYLAKIGECQLEAEADSLTVEDIEVVLFDCRWPTSLLAILLKKPSTMRIWRLDPTRSPSVHASDRSLPAKTIVPILATRSNVYDLLVLEPQAQLGIVTADGYSLTIDALDGIATLALEGAAAEAVNLVNEDGTAMRASFDMSPEDELVGRCLAALSSIVSVSAFLRARVAHLDAKRSQAGTNDFAAFSSVILPMVGGSVAATREPEDDWTALLADRDRADPSFCSLTALPSSLDNSFPAISQPFSPVEAQAVLLALHLVAEEAKILCNRAQDLVTLLPLLASIAGKLNLNEWIDYYRRSGVTALIESTATSTTTFPPPDLLDALTARLAGRPSASYPDIRAIDGVAHSRFYGDIDPCPISRQLLKLFALYRSPPTDTKPAIAIVQCMHSYGWTAKDVEALSLGVKLPILEAMRQCQVSPPSAWSRTMYELIGREDLARQAAVTECRPPKRKVLPRNRQSRAAAQAGDSLESLSPKAPGAGSPSPPRQPHVATQFSQDMRLEEVARMLQSWKPIVVRMPDRPELGEHDISREQQALAIHVATRTLALPIGSSMFTFRSEKRKPTDAIRVGNVTLTCKVLPQAATISADSAGVPADKRNWPDFHAGVAAALRIALRPGAFDLSDISFNKPDVLDARYAGFLYGLGLSGHIRTMASYQAFAYLDPKHELTSIGLLLGLSAAFVSTCDAKVTSVLSVHLSAFHPSDSTTLNVTQATQAAGMLGLGLVYLGTKRKKLADVAIKQLVNTRVVPLEGPETCREAYTIACGFTYGFIMLRAGKDRTTSASDAESLRLLRNLVTGDGLHDLPSAKNSMSTATDVGLTSPAATIALALVYLDSDRSDIADSLEIPQSSVRFDYVRPDLILLRILARALIMRSTIKPSGEWIESLVPAFILKAKMMGRGGRASSTDVNLAYWSIAAGSCMAIGLRYAGTANAEAHATMIRYFDQVRRFAQFKDPTIQGKFLRKGVRACSNVIGLALAAVMAGTGELHVLRRLRVLHGQVGEQSDFGSHLAVHMSLGLLFLGGGGYTLSTSPVATAVLLCALYPTMPVHSGDNRLHIQAARHLWVLAVEPRRLVARDVDSNEPIFLPIRIRVREGDGELRSQKLVTPTLIPELATVESIRVDSPRYFDARLSLSSNEKHLTSFLQTRTLYVKRRGGYLSYLSDAKGVRSLFSRSKTEAGAAVFDFGNVSRAVGSNAEDEEVGSLMAFASDSSMRAAIHHLCTGVTDSSFEAFASSVVVESLTQDKALATALYISLFLAAKRGDVRERRQLSMAIGFHARGWAKEVLPTLAGKELVGSAFVAHLEANSRLSTLKGDARVEAVEYFRRGTWPMGEEGRKGLASWLVGCRAPAVGVIGQLATMAGEAKTAGTAREEVEAVLRMTLERLTGEGAEESLIDVAMEAWC